MPFLSEELFQRLPARGDNWPESVCVGEYPLPNDVSVFYITLSFDRNLRILILTSAENDML